MNNQQNNKCYFLIFGADEGAVSIATRKLIKEFADEEDMDSIVYYHFNQIKQDPSILSNHLNSSSIFNTKTIIIIENCQESFPKELENILKTPSNNIAIFLGSELKKSSRIRAVFTDLQSASIKHCYKLEGAALTKSIKDYLDQKNAKYSNEIPDFLGKNLPSNQLLIQNEIDKLIAYAGENTITLDDVLSFNMMIESYSNSINFIFIIRVLQNYFLRILKVQQEIILGNKLSDIIQKMRFFLKQKDNLVYLVNYLSTQSVLHFLHHLIALEVSYKSDLIPENFAVKERLFSIIVRRGKMSYQHSSQSQN